MVSRTRVPGVLGFCLSLGISGVAAAGQGDSSPGESPRVMRIGGVLKDAQGVPRSGTFPVAFSIYAEPEGGSSLWAETQDVSVGGNARYEALLGSSRAEGFPAELLASGKLLWLGIQVGEETEQRPRVMLVSVAHALRADDAATLSGKALSELVQVEELKTPEGRKKLGLSPMATTDDVFTATADPGPGFISQATSGPPLQVSSTGKVDNLNADLLDDLDSSAFAQLAAANTFAADQTISANLSVGGTLTLPSSVLVQAAGDLFLHNSGTANTFLGINAGNITLTGAANTASGSNALFSNTTGSDNTATGASALFSNTTGSDNTASGDEALLTNTTGSNNTASGAFALEFNTTGSNNTASGARALLSNTVGDNNTASGAFALASNTTGGDNTASGFEALLSNTTGSFNTACGFRALQSNTTGNFNTANGNGALQSNTTGFNNTASGVGALFNNTTGNSNTASGLNALAVNTTGISNTATGIQALAANTSGNLNTAIGRQALFNNTTGSQNIAIGPSAGLLQTTGSNNIYIGDIGFAGESDAIRIGSTQANTHIAGIWNRTSPGGIAVFVDSSGKLGTVTSSRRFKEDIREIAEESDGLMRLRPVAFKYKPEIDPTGLAQYGLIAEEVAQVYPDLVVYDRDGKPETVRYHLVNALLLNEVQSQHRRTQEQEALISGQQRRIEALEARLVELEGSDPRTDASGKQ